MLEIKINDSPENFLKIKETLTRIGILSKKDIYDSEGKNELLPKKLYQSCHILHKQGRYYIVQFKELFALDGKLADISINDIERRNTIAGLLEDWGLLTIIDKDASYPRAGMNQIKVVSYRDKKNYELVSKYQIGVKSKFSK